MRAVGGDGRRARALISPNIPRAARKRGFAAFRVPGIKDESLEFDWAMVEQIRPQIDQPDPAWPSTFAGIAIPTLAIGGGPQSFVPSEHVEQLGRIMPDCRVESLDTGHLVHATDPEGFVRLVRVHLDHV